MLIQIKYLINYYTVSNNAIFYRLKYKSTLNLEIIIRRICNRKEWLICEVREEANQNGHIPSLKGPNRNKLISPSTANRGTILTVYQQNGIIGRYLDTVHRYSPGQENSRVHRCPERSVSVHERCHAKQQGRPWTLPGEPFLIVRDTVPRFATRKRPSLLRSIDSPHAPLNIHETISPTIEPDLHRAPILLRIPSRETRISL